jgi:hypothetical protein
MPKRNTFNARPVPKKDVKVRDAVTDVASFEYDEEFLEAAKKRISFWRKYPFHMCKHYLGITLKPFQCVLLYQMMNNVTFCFIAARGLGKTWLTAVYCICRCILYPGTKIVIASGVRSQAFEVFDKINDLYRDSPMLREEILFKTESKIDPLIEFKNGSTIVTVTANDNSRGKRCNLLVLDEFRMIDKDIVDAVLRKFKANSRSPKYLNLPQYKHLAERNAEILLTSAWLKGHWSYERYKATIKQMAAGKSYFCCNLPYQISVRNGLKKKEDIIDEMTETDFDPVKWKIEMEGYWLGEAENALFDNESLSACRKIEKAQYPLEVRNKCGKDTKRLYIPKAKDEIRLVFADIALMSSKRHKNDASCFGVMRLTPNSAKNDYLRDICYLESWTGQHSEATALQIRKLYDEFDADYIVMDANGVGLPIFDLLVGNTLVDHATGIEYPPLACCNDEEMNARCLYPNNPKVIWSIKGYAQLNSDMAIMLQNAINSRKLRLLVHENEGQEYLSRFAGYDEFNGDLIGKLKSPYVQTSLMIYEMLSLEAERKDDGKVKVKEQSGKRKDRYSAVAMGNYVATELARKNFKVQVGFDEEDDYVITYGFN